MRQTFEEIDDRLVTSGEERLTPGSIYTHGRLAFVCLKHEVGELPHLKLKTYPASFVEGINRLLASGFTTPEMALARAQSQPLAPLPHAVIKP